MLKTTQTHCLPSTLPTTNKPNHIQCIFLFPPSQEALAAIKAKTKEHTTQPQASCTLDSSLGGTIPIAQMSEGRQVGGTSPWPITQGPVYPLSWSGAHKPIVQEASKHSWESNCPGTITGPKTGEVQGLHALPPSNMRAGKYSNT